MIPKRYRIQSIFFDTQDTFTFVLKPLEEGISSFLPGQFCMLYLFGFGEIPISISGNSSEKEILVHTIRAVGLLTDAMSRLKEGDEIGVRGPFGSAWPLSKTGGDIVLLAGGLGLAPLRPALYRLMDGLDQYKRIVLLYGARTPADLLYQDEMQEWKQRGVAVQISVDRADASWRGEVGVVTALIHKHLLNPKNTRVLLCGPEAMMKYSLVELLRLCVPEEEIYLSMERNMKCATGFCGHCQYGPYFLCKDGPIFSYDQVKNWLPIRGL